MTFISKAFSLIELLIVLIIITVLATLSVVSYQAYVLRSYRAEAVATLLYLANKQEQHYANTGVYSNSFNELESDVSVLAPRYQLTITLLQQGQGYELMAEAAGAQLKDTECLRLTFNHIGQRNSTEQENLHCWN